MNSVNKIPMKLGKAGPVFREYAHNGQGENPGNCCVKRVGGFERFSGGKLLTSG